MKALWLATGLFGALALVTVALEVPRFLAAPGTDAILYLDRTREWLAGGDFYLPRQLAGPYVLAHGDALYPPTTLLLLVPLTFLPLPVYWLVPLGLIAYAWWRHRPSVIAYNYLALLACWPKTWEMLIYGNPALWAVGAIAAGTLWRPAYVGAAIKPILAPFALLGWRDRTWRKAAAGSLLLAAAFAPLWSDWLRAMANARNEFGLVYLLGDLPVALLPVVVYVGRSVPKHRPQHVDDADERRPQRRVPLGRGERGELGA